MPLLLWSENIYSVSVYITGNKTSWRSDSWPSLLGQGPSRFGSGSGRQAQEQSLSWRQRLRGWTVRTVQDAFHCNQGRYVYSIPCRLQKHLKKYKNLISDWMTLCWLQNNMSFILCYLYEQQMIGCKILQSCNALGSHHHGIRFVPRSSQLLPASPQHSGFLNSTSRSITMHQLPSM